MKNTIKLVIILIASFGFSQDAIDYEKIQSIGKAYTSYLWQGKIESLENANPPPGTFTYKDLLKYKKDLKSTPEVIKYGSYIEASNSTSEYAYNFFAFKMNKNGQADYYFAAIISMDVSKKEYNVTNPYLFTQKESLKNWWSHTFGFYHESNTDAREKIPKKFVYHTCPPPPFRS